jgi:hypothetical protein
MSDYSFFNMGRIGADAVDNTQRTMYNTRFANYTLSNFFSENLSGAHVDFATSQPNVMFNGVSGVGVHSGSVDVDSMLLLNQTKERSLEKLQLNERPFLTVPYLGKGGGDPTLESQLQQGAMIRNLKSISTVSENTYIDYSQYPIHSELLAKMNNPANSVEEAALSGWVRGGASSRE